MSRNSFIELLNVFFYKQGNIFKLTNSTMLEQRQRAEVKIRYDRSTIFVRIVGVNVFVCSNNWCDNDAMCILNHQNDTHHIHKIINICCSNRKQSKLKCYLLKLQQLHKSTNKLFYEAYSHISEVNRTLILCFNKILKQFVSFRTKSVLCYS